MKHNNINITDTFIDEGYSAKTFDRPDMKMLIDFVKKNYRTIDYLVVSELTRFSRDLGDAVNMVKKIQSSYDIRIVSAGRGAIYDCTDSNSFFMMALEFLLGNSENIKRENDIRGGIYTAKAKEGRFIHNHPPFGYMKVGAGKNGMLVIEEHAATVVRYIFTSFLKNIPAYLIKEKAVNLGLNRKGNSIIQKILSNPIYTGRQYVKSWRDHPGGLFPAKHEAIIDLVTWQIVQDKLKGKKPGIIVSDEMPLRGVLRCHCSQLLTGAPSRGRWGKYYNYYKCKFSKHNNISATKAHAKLDEVLSYLSLTDRLAQAIIQNTARQFTERTKESRKLLAKKITELDEINNRLHSMEEKYISNKIEFDTYTKWHSDLTQQRVEAKANIEKLNRDDNELYMLMQDNLEKFTDLKYLYKNLETTEKGEFIRLMFDSKLYYQEGIYRTPYIIPSFSHNILILKEKRLLVLDDKKGLLDKVPLSGAAGSKFKFLNISLYRVLA